MFRRWTGRQADRRKGSDRRTGKVARAGNPDGRIAFGAVGAADVEDADEVLIIIAPQSMVGASVYEPLSEMVAAANGRPVILINPRLQRLFATFAVGFPSAESLSTTANLSLCCRTTVRSFLLHRLAVSSARKIDTFMIAALYI